MDGHDLETKPPDYFQNKKTFVKWSGPDKRVRRPWAHLLQMDEQKLQLLIKKLFMKMTWRLAENIFLPWKIQRRNNEMSKRGEDRLQSRPTSLGSLQRQWIITMASYTPGFWLWHMLTQGHQNILRRPGIQDNLECPLSKKVVLGHEMPVWHLDLCHPLLKLALAGS